MNTTDNLLLIALDGTAASGKTTIGQMLAQKLGLRYLDTGAMYRAVTLLAVERGIELSPPDETVLANIARNLDFVSRDATTAEAADERQYTVLLEGRDVSNLLRTPEVERWVSVVAAIAQVRVELVARQREIAHQDGRGIVMMGRDIGSVVLPNADLKIFLDASPEVRAQRRAQQAREQHVSGHTAAETLHQLQIRDQIDSQRTVSPLVVPPDAVYISTDHLTRQEVLARAQAALDDLLRRRGGRL
jgi:cytidylate kinase